MIGAVLVVDATAPKLVTSEILKTMKPGAVVVDLSIDQGGCFESGHPKTHAQPTYILDDYCVTSREHRRQACWTFALNNATLPFVLALANLGCKKAMSLNHHLRDGLNIYDGKITHPAVAGALGLPYTPADAVLNETSTGAPV